ncbi:MAG TPA: tRNA glutamyl-Q(34) synthetase GluQRS [Beijerinckiaceae bacterium]|nr:tRNA glutamyl-Q(34) synthetase GluQRS [Beijerinckiaceae bacterium]
MQPVFRFAPSPNGFLHLGHAYSALLNQHLARESGGLLLLRIEDIDTTRCRPELLEAMFEDLEWLGLEFDQPVLRQSTEFARYRAVLERLEADGLVYPCFCSRKDIAAAAGDHPVRDPDGAPLYAGTCRRLSNAQIRQKRSEGGAFALRLDMAAALARIGTRPLDWQEAGQGRIAAEPALWGDVVLGRKEVPTSYHLSVVLDDAMQGVTDIVRGRDLFSATSIHRLLQVLLDLPEPRYRHHRLLTDSDGLKLAKSRSSPALRQLRSEGVSAADLRLHLGFAPI